MYAEAQAVITMRVLGMAGLWSVAPDETSRMFHEKVEHFPQAFQAATQAVIKGGDPLGAAIGPLHRQTRANVIRLSGYSPKRRI